MNALRTTLVWDEPDASHVAPVTVSYTVSPGYPADMTDPGASDTVEITGIAAGRPVPDRFLHDPDLLAECLADWRDDQMRAADDAAEQNRDDRNQWERLA